MLLIDNDQSEAVKLYASRQELMGADCDIHLAGGKPIDGRLNLFC